jgi:cardiolipin synthase
MNAEGEGLEDAMDRPDTVVDDEERSSEIFTLPNILSLTRILLTPVFVWAAVRGRPWLTFSLFLLAGATDALDGFTARKFRLKTHLGLWLDPAGDKILTTAAFVVLAVSRWSAPNTLPLWLPVVCIGRDVLIAVGVLVYGWLRGRTTFRPSLVGKASTICQVMTLLVVLLANGLGKPVGFLIWLYALTAALTAIAGVHYIIRGMVMLFRTGKAARV